MMGEEEEEAEERGRRMKEREREETRRGTANFHRKAAGFKLYA